MIPEKEYSPNTLEHQVLGYILNYDFYNKVKNIVSKDMSRDETLRYLDVIAYAHKEYSTNLLPNQVAALVSDRNPAMPSSAVGEIYTILNNLSEKAFGRDVPSNWMW